MKLTLLAGFGLVGMLVAPAAHATVHSMSATYYTISEADQDMNHLAGGVIGNEVQSAIGADNLPVLNTGSTTPQPADLSVAGTDGAMQSGKITWWSPALNCDVTGTGTGTIILPYSNGSFLPPNGTGSNDANGFQAPLFASTLNVPTAETISFNVGADDDAFVYLDGSIVRDLGGVHGDSAGTCISTTLGVGTHTLELFYADVERTGAALTFGINTQNVTSTPTTVPEPTAVALLGSAVLGLAMMRRRSTYRARG